MSLRSSPNNAGRDSPYQDQKGSESDADHERASQRDLSEDSDGLPAGTPFDRLSSLLTDGVMVENILEVERGTLTGQQKRYLRQIHQHFCGRKRDREDEGVDDGAGPVKRPRINHAAGVWGAILRLDHLALPTFLERHLDRNRLGQAENILDDPTLLQGSGGGGATNQGLLLSIRFTKQVEYRNETGRVCWLFAMIFFFDLIKQFWPDASGRVGSRMNEHIQACFQLYRPRDLTIDNTIQDMRKWSLRGKKLSEICRRFGNGAILFLSEQLSNDFLDHKVTLNGVKFDEAMAHLTVLELAGKAETSRANLLGNNVREYLLKQWSPQGVVVE